MANWVLHREEIETKEDGDCCIYFLLDCASPYYCYGFVSSASELPKSTDVLNLFKKARAESKKWANKVFISKKDPFVETLGAICKGLELKMEALPPKDLEEYTEELQDTFPGGTIRGFFNRQLMDDISEEDEDSARAFIPDPYDLCTCGSGKKHKFCCKPIFKDLIFAMTAAQDGNLPQALKHMEDAKRKVGETAEVLCRYASCYSFFDPDKAEEYIKRALKENEGHPRSNYILGIMCKESGDYEQAVYFYKKAIEGYPTTDKYHLNETYNNLGSAYYEMGDFYSAKQSWELALVRLPSDRVCRENLVEFIYENKALSNELRDVSPFIKYFL